MLSLIFTPVLRLLHIILGVSTPQKFPPPLPQGEETEAFQQMHAPAGEVTPEVRRQARQKLILHNLRLVSHIVRKYYSGSRNQEDLVSIGSIGLCKAIDSYDVEAGTKFATYAARCIQNEILMYFRAEKKHSQEVSMDDTIDVDRDGNPLTYMDVIGSDESLSDEVITKVEAQRALELVKTCLDPRERQVIMMRFGIGLPAPMTQRDIALRLGISRSYVSRIEKAAIGKLREKMGAGGQT